MADNCPRRRSAIHHCLAEESSMPDPMFDPTSPGYRSCWLNDDLDALREMARAFCEKEIKPNLEKFIEQHHVDRDLWNKAGELGLLCMSIPEEYGGGGGTFAH